MRKVLALVLASLMLVGLLAGCGGGDTRYHEKLEKMFAEFEKKEDAFLYNFGYQGIVSTIDALTARHDVIVYDAECHACLLDGIRLHIGSKYKYRHNNIEDCEKVLARACAEATCTASVASSATTLS